MKKVTLTNNKFFKFFFFLFFKKNHMIKQTIKMNIDTINQFNYVMNKKESFIVNISNYKSLINLECNFTNEEKTWEKLMEKIDLSILQKRQIVFQNFAICWEKKENFVDYPILIEKNELLKNNSIIDNWFDDKDPKIVLAFQKLNNIIDQQIKKDGAHLLISSGIKQLLIFFQKNNKYGLLFSEGII